MKPPTLGDELVLYTIVKILQSQQTLQHMTSAVVEGQGTDQVETLQVQ